MEELEFIRAAMGLAAKYQAKGHSSLETMLFDETYDGFVAPQSPDIDLSAGPLTTPDQDWSAE